MKFAAPLYKTLVNLLLIFNLVLQGILGLCLPPSMNWFLVHKIFQRVDLSCHMCLHLARVCWKLNPVHRHLGQVWRVHHAFDEPRWLRVHKKLQQDLEMEREFLKTTNLSFKIWTDTDSDYWIFQWKPVETSEGGPCQLRIVPYCLQQLAFVNFLEPYWLWD